MAGTPAETAREDLRRAGGSLIDVCPARRVTRPACGAVFLKIRLTRHRTFRDSSRAKAMIRGAVGIELRKFEEKDRRKA
jgi:hypothetical protein